MKVTKRKLRSLLFNRSGEADNIGIVLSPKTQIDSSEIQKALFSIGVFWKSDSPNKTTGNEPESLVKHTEKPHLVIAVTSLNEGSLGYADTLRGLEACIATGITGITGVTLVHKEDNLNGGVL